MTIITALKSAPIAAPETITFELNGETVEAYAGESLWDVARRLGHDIPHLCHSGRPGYRADGNCRACVVEVVGERALAASCVRHPTPGMRVRTDGEEAVFARKMVFELLEADQPEPTPETDNPFRLWAGKLGVTESRFPRNAPAPAPDPSHPAMAVNLDACVHCGLCARACREVQVNDVIGMAGRGHEQRIVFDQGDPMGASTCVGCGECVQACPTDALTSKTLAAAAPTRDVASVCPYCGVGCQLTYHVENDRVVGVSGRPGPANEGRLCVKGRFGFDHIHHPHRLTKPLIRREGVPKSDTDVDPLNPLTHFREASWEEALDRAAGGLKAIRDGSGGGALAGFGSAKGSNEEAYLFQKLVRVGFGTNNVDHCTRLCHASSVVALIEGIGSGAVTAPFNAALDAEVIVVIGSNPTENHPVAATYFKNAVKRGAKLVVMDPRGTALRRHATHMLRFTPGRDVAMLNAMINVIIAEVLYDPDFVRERTEEFAALAERVAPMTPEAMAPICGIDADTLRAVARLYAGSKASIIFWGMGVSQHTHGTDNARCLIALALITGQVGRPGTGLHPLRGQNNVQGASDAGLIPMMFPNYRPVDDAEAHSFFENYWGAELDAKRGLTVVEVMDAIHAGSLKGMYIMGENPAMSDPDVEHARDALAKLDHLVVQDLFLTETAKYADVVLPATAWPEKSGTVTNTNRQVQMGRPAVPPPGDARPDLWIINEMARRLGLDWTYGTPAQVYAEMAGAMASLDNIPWERLEREDAVTYPCAAPDAAGTEIVFGDAFPTASGKGRLVPVSLLDPAEEPDAEFPMVLTTGRQLEHWHTGTMTRRSEVLDALEPEAVAYLSPHDLEARKVAPGDRITVTTRRGSITLVARVDSGTPPGLIFIPFCYAEAAANVLTNPKLDPYGKIPEFKFAAARISPAGSP